MDALTTMNLIGIILDLFWFPNYSHVYSNKQKHIRNFPLYEQCANRRIFTTANIVIKKDKQPFLIDHCHSNIYFLPPETLH